MNNKNNLVEGPELRNDGPYVNTQNARVPRHAAILMIETMTLYALKIL